MKIVRLEDAIKRVQASPDSWVRVEQVRKTPKGLELGIGVYEGRRRRKAESWRIQCLGVREFKIDDVDGGGIALYSSTHPAAGQFVARPAILRWGPGNAAAAIGALCQAHLERVDDWIPIDRYVDIRAIVENKFVCRGPDFLLRAYAKALHMIGAQPQLKMLQKRKGKRARLRVLHFGSSSVVAKSFVLELHA